MAKPIVNMQEHSMEGKQKQTKKQTHTNTDSGGPAKRRPSQSPEPGPILNTPRSLAPNPCEEWP